MDVFVPYGGLHALAVAVCALLIAAPTLLARALPREAEVVFRRMLAALAVCYWLGTISATLLSLSAAYVALIVPVNLWLGSDYGFIGNPPADIKIPAFVGALGPWPQRAIILVALAAFGFLVVLLPWRIVARSTLCRPGMPGGWKPRGR